MIIILPNNPPFFSLVSVPRLMQTPEKEKKMERAFFESKQTETF